MSKIIPFPSASERKAISERLSSANAHANSTRFSKAAEKQPENFEERMFKVRKNLETINQLMADLKAKSREQLDK